MQNALSMKASSGGSQPRKSLGMVSRELSVSYQCALATMEASSIWPLWMGAQPVAQREGLSTLIQRSLDHVQLLHHPQYRMDTNEMEWVQGDPPRRLSRCLGGCAGSVLGVFADPSGYSPKHIGLSFEQEAGLETLPVFPSHLNYSVIPWLCWLINEISLVYGGPSSVKDLLFCSLAGICTISKLCCRLCYYKCLYLIDLLGKNNLYSYWTKRKYQPVKAER